MPKGFEPGGDGAATAQFGFTQPGDGASGGPNRNVIAARNRASGGKARGETSQGARKEPIRPTRGVDAGENTIFPPGGGRTAIGEGDGEPMSVDRAREIVTQIKDTNERTITEDNLDSIGGNSTNELRQAFSVYTNSVMDMAGAREDKELGQRTLEKEVSGGKMRLFLRKDHVRLLLQDEEGQNVIQCRFPLQEPTTMRERSYTRITDYRSGETESLSHLAGEESVESYQTMFMALRLIAANEIRTEEEFKDPELERKFIMPEELSAVQQATDTENEAVDEQREIKQEFGRMLDRVLERRGLDRSALEFIREWVEFPELMLIPTKSAFKPNFLDGFLKELAPEENIIVKGIVGSSDIHEQPFGQKETEEGAKNRLGNAMALVSIRRTGDEELDLLLREKTHGYIGVMENGMVAGKVNSDGVHLDPSKTEYDPGDDHFDVAYAILRFPEIDAITQMSPPDEAVRFDPQDANASFASRFDVTAGEHMQTRLAQQDPPVIVDKQNWHAYAIQREIEKARRLVSEGLPTTGLHTQEYEGFDRNEQLTGVLFDAFYQLAKNKKADFAYEKYQEAQRQREREFIESAAAEAIVFSETTPSKAQEILQATQAIDIASLVDTVTEDTSLEEVFGYPEFQLRYATELLARSRLVGAKKDTFSSMRAISKDTSHGEKLWLVGDEDNFVSVQFRVEDVFFSKTQIASTVKLNDSWRTRSPKYKGLEDSRALGKDSEYHALLVRNPALERIIGMKWVNNILLNWDQPGVNMPEDILVPGDQPPRTPEDQRAASEELTLSQEELKEKRLAAFEMVLEKRATGIGYRERQIALMREQLEAGTGPLLKDQVEDQDEGGSEKITRD